MEELVAKYAGAYDSDFEAEMSEGSTEVDSDESMAEEESGKKHGTSFESKLIIILKQ